MGAGFYTEWCEREASKSRLDLIYIYGRGAISQLVARPLTIAPTLTLTGHSSHRANLLGGQHKYHKKRCDFDLMLEFHVWPAGGGGEFSGWLMRAVGRAS